MRKYFLCSAYQSLKEEKLHFEIGHFAPNSKFIFNSMETIIYLKDFMEIHQFSAKAVQA